MERSYFKMSSGKKTVEKKASTRNGVLRVIFVVIAFCLEIAFIVGLFRSGLDQYAEIVSIVIRILALLIVLALYSQNSPPSLKIPWIILILLAPPIGVALYLMIGLAGSTKKMKERYENEDRKLLPFLVQNNAVSDELAMTHPSCSGVSRYIYRESKYPIYHNSKVDYFADASDGLESQKKDMREAKKFIFMEYFAIENAESWQGVEEILAEKASEGLDVRVFYDDVGSIGFINVDFVKRLEKLGIKCRVFNPMTPALNIFLNNRDHRKMTVIDGKIGYTGGYNIANEYFNVTSPYGYWKDTGIRIEGEAVRALTATFLSMWNAVRDNDKDDTHYGTFFPEADRQERVDGYVQFYADSPMDKLPVGEDVYMSMANRAKKYLYIITPYLIITDEMNRTLGIAAKRGVDVRIVTPGIPDKPLIYKITRSYYSHLAMSGVRIFEYTPGFCHAKMSVSDDIIATCGTINMDYRSLYHHFECGCLMVESDAVLAIRDDFEDIFAKSTEVTEKYRSGRSAVLRFGQLLLRVAAPLL